MISYQLKLTSDQKPIYPTIRSEITIPTSTLEMAQNIISPEINKMCLPTANDQRNLLF